MPIHTSFLLLFIKKAPIQKRNPLQEMGDFLGRTIYFLYFLHYDKCRKHFKISFHNSTYLILLFPLNHI